MKKLLIIAIIAVFVLTVLLIIYLYINKGPYTHVNDSLKSQLGNKMSVSGLPLNMYGFYIKKEMDKSLDDYTCLFIDDDRLAKEFLENIRNNTKITVSGVVNKRVENYGGCDGIKTQCGKHLKYCLNAKSINPVESSMVISDDNIFEGQIQLVRGKTFCRDSSDSSKYEIVKLTPFSDDREKYGYSYCLVGENLANLLWSYVRVHGTLSRDQIKFPDIRGKNIIEQRPVPDSGGIISVSHVSVKAIRELVSIVTNKNEYSVGETVEVTINNQSEHTIWFLLDAPIAQNIPFLERVKKLKWESLEANESTNRTIKIPNSWHGEAIYSFSVILNFEDPSLSPKSIEKAVSVSKYLSIN